jgi:DNA-binding Lrp family transcriptional regulator
MVKLDKKDIILINELRRNSRQPLTKLSSAARLSKENCIYRLKKLEKLLSLNYVTVINYAKLGYYYFSFAIRADKSHKDFPKLVNRLKKMKGSLWLTENPVFAHDEYNLLCIYRHRKLLPAEKLRLDLLENKAITDVELKLIRTIATEFEINGKATLIHQKVYPERHEAVEVDALDELILNGLETNSRVSNLELANRFKVSSNTIKNRIANLIKNKIIEGFTASIHHDRLPGFVATIQGARGMKTVDKFAGPVRREIYSHTGTVFSFGLFFEKGRYFFGRFRDDEQYINCIEAIRRMSTGKITSETTKTIFHKNLLW